jgi:hypothetical protein
MVFFLARIWNFGIFVKKSENKILVQRKTCEGFETFVKLGSIFKKILF